MKLTRYTAGDSKSLRPSAYDMAQQRAIERQRSRYIQMTCEHFTTWEQDEIYSLWRPKKNVHYCDKCGRWSPAVKHVSPESPAEPLF